MTRRIWVEGSEIRRNLGRSLRGDLLSPTVVVQDGGDIRRGFAIEILGPSRVVYRPEDPLQNGVVLWIETEAPVQIDDAPRVSGLTTE